MSTGLKLFRWLMVFPLFWFWINTYLFETFKCLLLVSTILVPLQEIHFCFKIQPRSFRYLALLFRVFLDWSFQGLMLLPFNVPWWIFFNFDSKSFSTVVLFYLLERSLSHEVFSFSSLMGVYFVLRYLSKAHCWDPFFLMFTPYVSLKVGC